MDLLRIKQSERYNNGGIFKKESVFDIFSRIFACFPHFTIFSDVEQISNLSFMLKERLLIQRRLKQCLLNIA